MIVSLEEMKNYLRMDYAEDDALIQRLISAAERLCMDVARVDFTIRWCKKAAEITSTGYRVEFNGELYDILAVDHMNFKRKSVKLSCQKVRR